MRLLFAVLLCLLLIPVGFGQDYFVKKLSFITGSTSAYYDKVLADGFGGCYVAGRRNNGGTRTTVLQHYNSSGAVLWTRTYSYPAEGKCVQILFGQTDPVFVIGYIHPSFGPRTEIVRLQSTTGSPVWINYVNMRPRAAAVSGPGDTSTLAVVGNFTHVSNPLQTRYTYYTCRVSDGQFFAVGTDPTSDNTSFEGIVYGGGNFQLGCMRNGKFQIAVLATGSGGAAGFGVAATLPGTYYGLKMAKLSGGDVLFAARRVNNGFGSGYFMRVQGTGTRVFESSAGAPSADFADLKAISFNRAIAVSRTGSPTSVGQVYRVQPDGVVVVQEYARTAGIISPRGFWVDNLETVHVAQSVDSIVALETWGMGAVSPGGWKHSFLWNFEDSEPYAMDTLDVDGTMFVVGRRDYGGIDVGYLAKVVAIPRTIADTYEMRAGTTWTENGFGPLLNDFGVDGATVTYTSQATHGTFSPGLGGNFTYVPDPGFAGSDGVAYRLSRDGQASPDTIVALIVQPEIIAIDAPTVNGGTPATLTIRLTGNRQLNAGTVYLADNSPQTAMPATVTIPVNTSSKTFTLTTSQDLVDRTATIFAQMIFPNSTQTFTKTITIKALKLANFTLSPAALVGGRPFNGTVTLSTQAVADTAVNITHSGTDVATPASVTVPAGQSSASFDASTSVTSTSVTRTVTATFNGVSLAKNLTLDPGGLYALTVNPPSVKGGVSTQGKLQTAGLAPAGGTTALLSVTGGNVAVPSSAVVPAGAQFGTFTITTTTVTTNQTRTITAQWGTITKTATLTLTP